MSRIYNIFIIMTQKITYSVVIGRNGKPDRHGQYLVHIEAYQCGRRVFFSTHIHLPRECFAGGLVVNHPLADKYNACLYKFRNEIEALELDMIAAGKRCTLAILKAAVDNKSTEATSLSCFTETVINSSGRCEHTRSIYRTTMKVVEAFQPGATLQDIDYDFLIRFQNAQISRGMARAVKPSASSGYSSGLWKGKGVTGLSISISAEGLRFYGETENGFNEIGSKWGEGQSVEVKCFEREGDASPYVQGKFVIARLEESSPAQDDATYSISLENDGEPDVYPGKASD